MAEAIGCHPMKDRFLRKLYLDHIEDCYPLCMPLQCPDFVLYTAGPFLYLCILHTYTSEDDNFRTVDRLFLSGQQ